MKNNTSALIEYVAICFLATIGIYITESLYLFGFTDGKFSMVPLIFASVVSFFSWLALFFYYKKENRNE